MEKKMLMKNLLLSVTLVLCLLSITTTESKPLFFEALAVQRCLARCPRSVAPVCSSLGTDYRNSCQLRCHGQSIGCYGTCASCDRSFSLSDPTGNCINVCSRSIPSQCNDLCKK